MPPIRSAAIRSASRRNREPLRPAGQLGAKAVIAVLLSGCGATETNPATDGDRPPHCALEPPAEFSATFSVIRAIMALPDGRLVVSDPQENRVTLIDFPKGTRRQLGRVGEGPQEFRRPGGLYRGRGGEVLIFDQQLMRLLPVSPSGALEDVVGLPVGGMAGDWSGRAPDPLSFDSLGHTYEALRNGGFTAPTSLLMRHRPGARPDTVTSLHRTVTRALQASTDGAGAYQDVIFSPEDAWTVAPDGRVAVARAAPYHVEWIPVAGPTVTGPAITHRPVPITSAEKELIASGAAGPRGRTTVSIGRAPPGGLPSSQSGAPSPIPVGELLFAKVKTPVNLREGRWPLLDEGGRLWVERSLPAGAKISVFDVFDRDGNLVDRIALPDGSRLVGFDLHWIYAARIDADGLEHLQRLALPH